MTRTTSHCEDTINKYEIIKRDITSAVTRFAEPPTRVSYPTSSRSIIHGITYTNMYLRKFYKMLNLLLKIQLFTREVQVYLHT